MQVKCVKVEDAVDVARKHLLQMVEGSNNELLNMHVLSLLYVFEDILNECPKYYAEVDADAKNH